MVMVMRYKERVMVVARERERERERDGKKTRAMVESLREGREISVQREEMRVMMI